MTADLRVDLKAAPTAAQWGDLRAAQWGAWGEWWAVQKAASRADRWVARWAFLMVVP